MDKQQSHSLWSRIGNRHYLISLLALCLNTTYIVTVSFYGLLAKVQGGYGFLKKIVCSLINQKATVAQFKQKFENQLVRRARTGDNMIFYFTGHVSLNAAEYLFSILHRLETNNVIQTH
jgi:hypothetical protein